MEKFWLVYHILYLNGLPVPPPNNRINHQHAIPFPTELACFAHAARYKNTPGLEFIARCVPTSELDSIPNRVLDPIT